MGGFVEVGGKGMVFVRDDFSRVRWLERGWECGGAWG